MTANHAKSDQPGEEQEQPQELQLPARKCSNLYSEPELIRHISEYITDCACNLGYDPDTFYSNIRILLSTLACATGVVASGWLPYPEQKEILVLAIVLFFSLMLSLFLIDIFVMQGATACVRDSQGKPLFIGVGVDTKKSTAIISLRREGSRLSYPLPLSKCFDTEGYLLIDNVTATLETLFDDFEKGVTDESKKAGKKRS